MTAHWNSPGPEVIKLEYSLKLKIERNDWLQAANCKQPIIVLYFEFENELKGQNSAGDPGLYCIS